MNPSFLTLLWPVLFCQKWENTWPGGKSRGCQPELLWTGPGVLMSTVAPEPQGHMSFLLSLNWMGSGLAELWGQSVTGGGLLLHTDQRCKFCLTWPLKDVGNRGKLSWGPERGLVLLWTGSQVEGRILGEWASFDIQERILETQSMRWKTKTLTAFCRIMS